MKKITITTYADDLDSQNPGKDKIHGNKHRENVVVEDMEGNTMTLTQLTGASATTTRKPLCYSLLGVNKTKRMKVYINPTGKGNMTQAFVVKALNSSMKAWDSQTSRALFSTLSVNSSLPVLVQDGRNLVSFANSGANGVLASTSLYIDGLTFEIIEYDMIFNTYYPWGDAATSSSKIDFQSTATHEFGHVLGLGEVTDSTNCYNVTMYIAAKQGQTFRRSLEPADITGLRKIYGK